MVKRIANQLKADMGILKKAFEWTENLTQEFLIKQTNGEIVHHVTVEYATWLYFRFKLNKKRYMNYLKDVLKNRRDAGNILFCFDKPYEKEPIEDALKLLDRIDISLNYLKQLLDIELPYQLKGVN